MGQGTVFVADHANHRVRRIDASGVLTTVTGDGLRGFRGRHGRGACPPVGRWSGFGLELLWRE
ncbi:hypothetical protein BFF78_27910 [Streptomyces fodineus]|uniref:SMP-30/Gluconolactonase/LRE-like region domain-containing protein n=1 Tax=Streptomyces fodineus TaxID=1904616 RepID=A0A1D7YFH9_9ACTN|nr:hypothetical protein BFF78_27910 [Streptomyces fodineus]